MYIRMSIYNRHDPDGCAFSNHLRRYVRAYVCQKLYELSPLYKGLITYLWGVNLRVKIKKFKERFTIPRTAKSVEDLWSADN